MNWPKKPGGFIKMEHFKIRC